MSVWKTAYTMGFKRCGSMIKEFKYLVHKPGEDIVREGLLAFSIHSISSRWQPSFSFFARFRERGFKFYIIISGTCSIRKAGLGKYPLLPWRSLVICCGQALWAIWDLERHSGRSHWPRKRICELQQSLRYSKIRYNESVAAGFKWVLVAGNDRRAVDFAQDELRFLRERSASDRTKGEFAPVDWVYSI